jgi:hypothetical protein
LHEPNGEVIWQQSHQETIQTVTLPKKVLEDYRRVFPAYLDADDFTLS